ncbi:BCCT family transporter [Roseospirillum parvum]|uniref:Choline/glycine/proline betaine transport protein n=1 Tax=Roseospirillum parvum TaxID=83401 RepID=A0A1G8FYQ6_9PROT|nr:choline BCCT transporter BetT [Roseospirillum parvum]SDH87294.1 choline/glycine/proline betaine transport protein [Roseospirillum parvum]
MRLPETINPPVFIGSAALTLAFVVFGVSFPEAANSTFAAVQTWIVETFGWFYMLAVAVFVVFALGLALSPHGQVRLGPDDSRPDYSYASWFAMLFSAGMGIGLMFFGVAEPMMHFTNPPVGVGGDVAAAREAMKITFFHWGIHAWAIYAVIGLALAYYAFRHDLPLTIRSALHPLLGERIHGPLGHAADIFAVLGTMFGVATSLGLGVLQVNAGLAYLFDVPETPGVQLLLIAVITLMATASVVAGLDAGIKRLSNLNLILALILLVFVLLAGPTLFLLKVTVQNTGAYLSEVVSKTFTLYAYEPNEWIGGWTLFYWAWWIAWSPFVGMFIARVSRGRTIREFVVGVLLVPVGFTFLWLSVFGNGGISLDQGVAGGAIARAVSENVPLALFTFLEQFPWAGVSSLVATVLVVTFFVTSSDSGSLVIDIITSGGRGDTPVWQRTMWALAEGLVAAALLLAGGLGALQTASITAALPFAFVMLAVCYALLKSLRIEAARREAGALMSHVQIQGAEVDWRRWLANIVHQPRRGRIEAFLHNTVLGAMQEVAEEVGKLGHLEANARIDGREAALTIHHGSERDFLYAVKPRSFEAADDYAFAQGQGRGDGEAADDQYYRAEVFLSEGSQNYDVFGYTREQIIGDILSQYQKHVQFLHLTR